MGTGPPAPGTGLLKAGIDLNFVESGLQAVNVAGVVLYQFGVDVEVDDVGFVFVGENLAEECAADFLLHVEHSELAAGGINEDAEGQRQIRFGGEVFDGLRLAVFEDLEVIFGEVGNERAVLVFDVEEESDHVDADFEGLGGRLLVFGLLGVGGLLGRGGLSASLGRGRWRTRGSGPRRTERLQHGGEEE